MNEGFYIISKLLTSRNLLFTISKLSWDQSFNMATSSSAETILSPPEFTFAPADTRLLITYKGAPAYAHVSSQVLAVASPIWKNFLFPPWSVDPISSEDGIEKVVEGVKQLRLAEVKQLDFTDDSAEALLVLLCVAHLKFEDILKDQPSRQLLIDLAITCDKYLCPGLIRPWVGVWIEREFLKEIYSRSCFNEWHAHTIESKQAMMLVGRVFGPVKKLLEYDFFEHGARYLCYASPNNDLPDFPPTWPMPGDLMSMYVHLHQGERN